MPGSRAEENNGFGPLHKGRSRLPMCVSVFILLLYVVFIVSFDSQNGRLKSFEDYVFAFGFSFLAVLIGELIRRFCLFLEECRHRNARYEGSLEKAVCEVFSFENNKLVCVLAAIAIIITAAFCTINDWASFNHNETRLFFLNAIFIPIFVHVVGMTNPSKVEYSQKNEEESKNLADGLAWSYYFGYLKFVLPALREKITDYGDRIDVKKLFILLPKNCYVFDTISNINTNPQELIKDEENLAPLKINRGGIINREYKHTVYSILETRDQAGGGEERKHFCVMEYATPLMTLYDMSNHTTAGLSRKERDHQVNLFCNKLKNILDEDPQCKGTYELILFSGQTGQDLANIMINALKNPPVEIRD